MITTSNSWTDDIGPGGVAKPSTALWIVTLGGAVLLSGLVAAVVLSEPKKIVPTRRHRRVA